VSEEHDGLFRMVYGAVGEIGLIVENQGDVIGAGNVFGSDYDELVPGNVAVKRDVRDFSASCGTAHGGAVKHFRERQIVNIKRLADDFLAAFFTRN
jgi:hypothetical protein